MTDKEAMKLALDALKENHYYMINSGLPNQSMLNKAFTAYKALEERLAQPPQRTEPICPECKAEVLYECVVCSSNNYPPLRTEQEPVEHPYAYEYGRNNYDGTYSVVIEKGDLVQTSPAVYNYVRPRNAHKDWPIKELFDRPQRTWVGLTDAERSQLVTLHHGWNEYAQAIEAKLKEKNT
jgi:hypothetical protein